ncbi:MAG: hypothetical protein KBA02_00050 [Paludibacteraceae bacterium]|nr:hypothetical protein [Paludibacteraceae bacterium]
MSLTQSKSPTINSADNATIVEIFDDTADILTTQNVPAQNGTDNTIIRDVIGNRTDRSFSNFIAYPSIIGHLMAAYNHVHSPSIVYPRNAAPIVVTAGAGAYTEGNKTEIISAANAPTNLFDIHWVIIGEISANDDYIVKIYTGGAGSEQFWGEASFTRDTNQVRGSSFPIQGPPIPAGTRISATLMSGTGGNNVEVKIYTHIYNGVTGV